MKNSGAPRNVFLVMAVIIVVSTVITFSYGRTVVRAHALAALRHSAIAQTEMVISTMKDAETGQRGFIITGEENYLEPYHQALARLPGQLAALRASPVMQNETAEIARITELTNAKTAELNRTINLRRTAGPEAAAAAVRTGVGKQTMDDLRSVIMRLEASQDSAFAAARDASDRLTHRRSEIFGLTALVNLLFLAWAYGRIRDIFVAREAARLEAEAQRAEAQRQREYLSVTLASIGDAVIVTDQSGRVSFMNKVAEELTGWELARARQSPTGEVFRIISEATREPVENPVEKVLRSGVIVGLANHTLLIRRDGTELPIDDSGAPIRDQQGQLHGVVLVFRDFTERRRVEIELREAKETAEKANRAKDQFLAMLSHELRTPLTPVLTTLSLWEASDEVPAAMQPDVLMMRRSVELEARIIDDLLDLTRIARGMLAFSPENTDVHDLIRLLVNMSQSAVHDKRLRVATHLDAPRHHVHTDASRLQQVLWNIVRNAVKFTTQGGSITISTTNDAQNNLSIHVADTGVGITPEKLERLFLPFDQAGRAGANQYGGLGLGLAISQALVDLLHGELRAESEGPGRGSKFTVTFATIDAPAETADRQSRASRPDRPLRILLVEDHADTARALVRLLKTRGFEVETAGTVAAGIERAEHGTFDLLLCDIGLPDGTGFELIQQVRKTRDTPALALSGFGTEEDVDRSRVAGFGAHLTKPVNFQKLEATIWQLTGVH